MKKYLLSHKYQLYAGVTLFILGSLDPMEGSLLIAPASLLIAYARYRTGHKHWPIYTGTALAIVVGVAALWYLSSLGGFGTGSPKHLSYWWGLSIAPYPLGWITLLVLLLLSLKKKP